MFTSSWEHNHWIAKHSNDKRVGRNLSRTTSSFHIALQHGARNSSHTDSNEQMLRQRLFSKRNGQNCRSYRLGTSLKRPVKQSGTQSKLRRQESSFCNINGLVSNQELWIGGKVPKVTKDERCWEVILWKTIPGTTPYLRSKVLQRHIWRPPKA